MEDFYFVAAVPSGFENGLFEARQAHFYNHSMSLIFCHSHSDKTPFSEENGEFFQTIKSYENGS